MAREIDEKIESSRNEIESEGPLQLARFLPYRFATLSNRISRRIAQLYSDRFDLTIQEWRIMAVLGGEPDLSASQVAERTAMDKVAVSRAVSRLLEKGRLERHFSPQDRRRSVLALSEAGSDIYKKIVPIALAFEKALLEQLSDEEIDRLDSLFTRLEAIDLESLKIQDN